MNYGSAVVLGMGVFILCFGMFFVLPDLNFINWGLDFTSMDENILSIFRIGILTLAFFGLFYGATGGGNK